ncbi:hypothetical protein ACVGXV_22670, partial [Enterobacter intestinihominis]
LTAGGGAFVGGVAVGLWQNLEEVLYNGLFYRVFRQAKKNGGRFSRLWVFNNAVKLARAWEVHDVYDSLTPPPTPVPLA